MLAPQVWGWAVEVAVYDEAPGVARSTALRWQVDAPTISAAALIRARVELEVERLGDELIIKPTAVEQRLNGPRTTTGPRALVVPSGASLEAMVHAAHEAFRTGKYFLFAGERQIETLEEEIDLRRTMDIVFLRLIALQGG